MYSTYVSRLKYVRILYIFYHRRWKIAILMKKGLKCTKSKVYSIICPKNMSFSNYSREIFTPITLRDTLTLNLSDFNIINHQCSLSTFMLNRCCSLILSQYNWNLDFLNFYTVRSFSWKARLMSRWRLVLGIMISWALSNRHGEGQFYS